MVYSKRKPKYRWREFLTDEEALRIEQVEASRKPTPAMKLDYALIRNRAVQRALRALVKEA